MSSATVRDVLATIVKANDVRGLVATQLVPDVARALGMGVAEVVGGPIVVGRDMRPSGPDLVTAFVAGVTSRGVDVVDIGLVSTDQLYFASGHLDLPGVVFTASHNPPDWNGMKVCRAGAAPVGLGSGLGAIRDRAAAVLAHPPAPAPSPGHVTRRNVDAAFGDHVRSFADLADATMRIAVDAGNGMGGHVVPLVFDPLPIEVDRLYFELDGTFPNHPANPLDPANLADLSAHVVAHDLPLGLAFDGDADRMFAVDEQGRPVSSSLVGAVVATRLLARDPGATVLHNLICSRSVPEAIAAAGGVPVRTRVGHTFIKERMAETGAIFAVEHSGHYYFRDFWRADSGLVAAVLLLEAVASRGLPLSEVVTPFDRYVDSGERNFTVADPQAAIEAVATDFRADLVAADRLDGLTIELPDGWFNVRASNTEPLLRLNVEAGDRAMVARIVDRVAAIVA
jgi:phosphomannomutase